MDGELEQLGERIAEQAAHFDAALHRLLTDLRDFDVRGGWHRQGAKSCAHWLSWRVGWDLVTARERVRVAGKLAEFPAIDDALRLGEVSYSKVRAMMRVATEANETLLLDYARLMPAAQLEKLTRKYALVQRHGQESTPRDDKQRRYVRRRDTDDGMVKIEAVLHPEEAEMVWTMLDHAAKQLVRDPDRGRRSNDSAESPEAAASANTATACSSECSDTRSNDDSAESPVAPTSAHGATVWSAEYCDAGPSYDSAESLDVSISADTAAARSPECCVEAGPSYDSAESQDASISANTAAARSPEYCDTAGPSYDSAESPDVSISADTAAARSPEYCDAGPSYDSAESPDVSISADTAAARSPEYCDAAGPSYVSAESLDVSRSANTAARSPASPTSATTAAGPSAVLSGTYQLDDSAESRQGCGECTPGTVGSTSGYTAVGSTSGYTAGERHPRAGARGASVLHQQEDATKRAFSRADALVTVAQDYLRGGRPDRAPIDITLTIPLEGLRGEAADPVEVGELGESFLSREAARRLSCDAGVVEVIEDEHGSALAVGRKRRTISGALKRALHRRDKTCTFPGCANRIFLEGHHIEHWADGGETSLSNGLLLCTSHHRYVHEYGYAIELGPDQRPQFRDPRGRLVPAVPASPTAADLGWPRLRAVNEPLAIDAETIACEWDGSPVDYGAIVGYLAVTDGLA
jgi:hypothetical protein